MDHRRRRVWCVSKNVGEEGGKEGGGRGGGSSAAPLNFPSNLINNVLLLLLFLSVPSDEELCRSLKGPRPVAKNKTTHRRVFSWKPSSSSSHPPACVDRPVSGGLVVNNVRKG